MKKLLTSIILLGAVIQGNAQISFTSDTACFGQATTLTAPDSTDMDSVITAWNWDLDNDGVYNDGSGMILFHTSVPQGQLVWAYRLYPEQLGEWTRPL